MYNVEIMRDECPESPRDWDNLGTIFYSSRDYMLGDEKASAERINDLLQADDYISLAVYAYIHGGVTIWTILDAPIIPASHIGWDTGRAGCIAVSKAEVREQFGWKHITAKRKGDILRILNAEVKVFDTYLRGEVYGYNVTDASGEDVESCFGFYGEDEARSEAQHVVKYIVRQDLEKHLCRRKAQIRHAVPFRYRKPFKTGI